MQPSLPDSPFAALTVAVAPAILTNACSVLALGTANRIARVVDRTRYINERFQNRSLDSRESAFRREQLSRLRARSQMLVQALRVIYAALGLFAAAALVTVLGSTAAYFQSPQAFFAAAGLAFVVGVAGAVCLVYGCSLMVAETRLALRQIEEEVETEESGVLAGGAPPPREGGQPNP